MPGQLARLKVARTGRRYVVQWALLAAVWSAQAHAVGLGEIQLKSALNQRFDAQIELTDARGMQPAEIVVRLGSNEDFARVGVERFFFLTDLNFKVEQDRNGRTVLHVTSSQPVSEPFLNFVVQVIWPSGRLLKEYTVLLDPPAFTDNVAPAVAAPGRTDPGGGGAGRVERQPQRPDSQVSLNPAARPATAATPPSARLKDGTYGVTDRDDTLWAIASRAQPGGATVHQTMLAIARMNPEAFIGGNINLLKAGYVLRLPNEAEASGLGRSEAVAAVAEHNQAWQAYRRTGTIADMSGGPGSAPAMAGQVDATVAPAARSAAAPAAEGELRIVAGEAGGKGASATGGDAGAVEALEAQLAATAEEVDRVSRERDEAVYRLDQTTAEAEQTQRQIEVRDQQIAQLQAELDALKAQPTPAGSEPAKAAAAGENGGLMDLLASPVVWIGGGLIAVLLLVAGLVTARRRRAAADDELPAYEPQVRQRAAAVATAPTLGRDVQDDDEAGAEPFTTDDEDVEPAAAVAEGHDDDEHASAQTSDVIGEADIYIAYGRYPQALNLLLGALEDDPARSDVRLKLLEIYAETRDAEAFDRHMAELVEHCDDDEILFEARELSAKLTDADALTSSAPAAAAAAEEVAEFDLDLDDDADASDAALAIDDDHDEVSPVGRGDELGGDLGIDFDPDEGSATSRRKRVEVDLEQDDGEVAVAADSEPTAEFDLEDLELDVEPPKAAPRPAAGTTDDAFDFLDEEDTASTKLDLARAYIDMGDEDGAREILAEVVQEGSSDQQKQAQELLARL